jgi:hypothetical protein
MMYKLGFFPQCCSFNVRTVATKFKVYYLVYFLFKYHMQCKNSILTFFKIIFKTIVINIHFPIQLTNHTER